MIRGEIKLTWGWYKIVNKKNSAFKFNKLYKFIVVIIFSISIK